MQLRAPPGLLFGTEGCSLAPPDKSSVHFNVANVLRWVKSLPQTSLAPEAVTLGLQFRTICSMSARLHGTSAGPRGSDVTECDEMDGPCSAHGRERLEMITGFFVGKSERKRHLGRPGPRCEIILKAAFKGHVFCYRDGPVPAIRATSHRSGQLYPASPAHGASASQPARESTARRPRR
jgi:hypothetical protein